MKINKYNAVKSAVQYGIEKGSQIHFDEEMLEIEELKKLILKAVLHELSEIIDFDDDSPCNGDYYSSSSKLLTE